MIGFAAERVMELEVGAVTGAAYGETLSAVARRITGTVWSGPRFFDLASRGGVS